MHTRALAALGLGKGGGKPRRRSRRSSADEPSVAKQGKQQQQQQQQQVKQQEHQGQGHQTLPPLHVAEQRVTNLIQALLCGAALAATPAIQQMPTAVLWGYFAYMSVKSLPGNQLWERLLLLGTDPRRRRAQLLGPHAPYLQAVPFQVVARFTLLQLGYLAGIWALVTFAGVGRRRSACMLHLCTQPGPPSPRIRAGHPGRPPTPPARPGPCRRWQASPSRCPSCCWCRYGATCCRASSARRTWRTWTPTSCSGPSRSTQSSSGCLASRCLRSSS
jgi:hypothetical protein